MGLHNHLRQSYTHLPWELWTNLMNLQGRVTCHWALLGDFNEVLLSSKVEGGQFNAARAVVFSAMLEQCNLVDLGSVGGQFTWFRCCEGRSSISKWLDRGVGDSAWWVAFPKAVVEHLCRIHSDHNPFFLRCGRVVPRISNRPFRYKLLGLRT